VDEGIELDTRLVAFGDVVSGVGSRIFPRRQVPRHEGSLEVAGPGDTNIAVPVPFWRGASSQAQAHQDRHRPHCSMRHFHVSLLRIVVRDTKTRDRMVLASFY